METETESPLLEGTIPQPSTKGNAPDLSAEIAKSLEKLPGERIKCTRVYGDSYRVNWIAPDTRADKTSRAVATPARDRFYSRDAAALQTYFIRQSKFIRATRSYGKLLIEDLTASAKRN